MKKIISKNKYSYKDRLKRLGSTTSLERSVRGKLTENVRRIKGITDYGRLFFFCVSPQIGNLLSKQIS